MTDINSTADQQQPTLIEKTQDTLTDAQYIASHSRGRFEEIAKKIRGLDDFFPAPDAALDHIADFTRRNPLTASGWHSQSASGSIARGKK